MRYLSVTEIAKKWELSERSVRNYCSKGRVNGAFLTGKIWNIPEDAEKPQRLNKKNDNSLLAILKEEKKVLRIFRMVSKRANRLAMKKHKKKDGCEHAGIRRCSYINFGKRCNRRSRLLYRRH